MTMDVSKIGWEGMNWMPLVQGSDQWQAVVNTGMKIRVA